jgi:hypothetical protein
VIDCELHIVVIPRGPGPRNPFGDPLRIITFSLAECAQLIGELEARAVIQHDCFAVERRHYRYGKSTSWIETRPQPTPETGWLHSPTAETLTCDCPISHHSNCAFSE